MARGIEEQDLYGSADTGRCAACTTPRTVLQSGVTSFSDPGRQLVRRGRDPRRDPRRIVRRAAYLGGGPLPDYRTRP